MKTKHPYELRKTIRQKLPWFLINLGIAKKGKNCELVNAKHLWYNMDNYKSGCYFCKEIKTETKWSNKKAESQSKA